MSELLIYTPVVTQRTSYIFELFFDSIIPTSYSITTNAQSFDKYNGPKLNYSTDDFANNKLQIIPFGLLEEKGIKKQAITVSNWNKLKIFFAQEKGILPFDVFSASFFLVSRYEEYLPNTPDVHRRYHHSNSVAFKNHFLEEPLINLWAEELKNIIQAEYPAIPFFENTYTFIPTMDIDVAYAYLGRKLPVIIGSYLKNIYKLQITVAIKKKLVFLHVMKDPYDTFTYQEMIFKKHKLQPIYFFLAGKRGNYDKNISPKSFKFKKLVSRISAFAEIGIHPSYQSASNPEIISTEIAKVAGNISRKITRSRQHFLKLSLPKTYRCLMQLGITDDYTMSYAGAVGFRASICTPFFFYDLQEETKLSVKVHSSVVMDGTLNEYLKLLPADAISIIHDMVYKVKKFKGEFIPIWHNHTINDSGYWKGWKAVFEDTIEFAK